MQYLSEYVNRLKQFNFCELDVDIFATNAILFRLIIAPDFLAISSSIYII